MPELHLTRQQIVVGAVVLLGLLLLGSRLLGAGSRAAVAPPIPTSSASQGSTAAASLVVDVVGAVRRPGLYRVPRGSRIADAVRRAGGATRKAQLDLVNLAAPVVDGEQVVVPRRGPIGGVPASPATGEGAGGPVYLSTATLEQLDALPGIGPVTAQKILDYRQQHGGFTSVEQLDAVPGIGPARIDQLKGLVVP